MIPMSEDARTTIFICFTIQGILNVFTVAITLYIVWLYSPPGTHQQFQMLVLICGLFSDISCAILCPMPIVPIFGVYSISPIKFLPRTVLILACTYLFFFFCQAGGLISSLLYKAYVVLQGRQKHLLRAVFLPLASALWLGIPLFPACFIAAFNTGLEEQTKRIIAVMDEYAPLQLETAIIMFPFEVIYVKMAFLLALFYAPYSFLAPCISFTLTYRQLMKEEATLSQKTIRLKKKMIYCVFAQLLTPAVIMIVPYFFGAVKLVLNVTIVPEKFSRLMALLAGFHTIFNCLIIFAFSPKYRSELRRILMCRRQEVKKRHSTVFVTARRTTVA